MLLGVCFTGVVMYFKYGMGMSTMNDEFKLVLEQLDCEELYNFSFDKDLKYVQKFVFNNCIFYEVEEEIPYIDQNRFITT